MATLETPHWESTPPETRRLLEAIGAFPFCRRFYLGGGTALALRLGHRISRDLDFFSETDEVGETMRGEILSNLRQSFSEIEILTNAPGDLTVSVMSRDIGFYSYGYHMLESQDELLNVGVAGLLDIAAMKFDAIAGRGARRDFYDLYALAQHSPLEELLERAQQKYPEARDYPMTVMPYLIDFGNAERDKPIETQIPVEWSEVKGFFLAEVQRLAKGWFLPPEEKP